MAMVIICVILIFFIGCIVLGVAGGVKQSKKRAKAKQLQEDILENLKNINIKNKIK